MSPFCVLDSVCLYLSLPFFSAFFADADFLEKISCPEALGATIPISVDLQLVGFSGPLA